MLGLTPGQFGAALAVGLVVVAARGAAPAFYFGDAIALAILALMLWWFSTAGRKPAGHEQADEGVPFRIGKALNRILRRHGR